MTSRNWLETTRHRRLLLRFWILLWLVAGLLILYPSRSTLVRSFILLDTVGRWLGLLVVFWSRKLVRYACLATCVIFAALYLLPGREASSANLRRNYVRSLLDYEGTPYVW